MRITLTAIHVDDQDKALRFYTEVLGFVPSQDIPAGEYRWISVRSAQGGETELSLEPDAHPASRAYMKALFDDGIPATSFEVDDVDAEFDRLTEAGVVFTREPMDAGPVRIAVFSDTCGNLIQIHARST
jgi:glyoxylase I family protein